MSLLLTIMLLSALPFPILATIKVAERFSKPSRCRASDSRAVSAR